MRKQPSLLNTWADYQWEAIGVAVRANARDESEASPQLVYDDGEITQYLYRNYEIRLHVDEVESYYFNLLSETPGCYVITRQNDENVPVPFLVSLSFDEANAYLESDENVYVVGIPPELYRWVEAYVLIHYAPEKRKKRKRTDWRNPITNGTAGG